MENQPIYNIGIIGHVSNGKSTITKCLTGKITQQHSDEKKRNITIKLGYANCKIYKCNCIEPECYKANIEILNCNKCNSEYKLVNHISICDVPGHNSFMTTMMNGTSVMDSTIIVESVVNEDIPAKQTIEHLYCTKISNIPNNIICVNKLDLIKKEQAIEIIEKIKKGVKNTTAENSKIIPMSASLNINIDYLLQELSKLKPINKNYNEPGKMLIIRSFNVNKGGINLDQVQGGIVGGSIISGNLELNKTIIIKPGFIYKQDNKFKYYPIKTKILSINSEKTDLVKAISGGLIGLQLDLDPYLTTDDGLVGNLLFDENNKEIDNYKIFTEIKIKKEKILAKYKNEIVLININACNNKGLIRKVSENNIYIKLLDKPVCINLNTNNKCVISINKDNNIKILNRYEIIGGTECELY